MSDNEAEKLILVGFTNPYQIRYAQEDYGGSFYPDAKYGCSIPLYMLKRHENRLHTGEQLASTIAALNAKPEPDTVTISRECAEYLGMMLPRILSDRGIAHYKELTKAMEVQGE